MSNYGKLDGTLNDWSLTRVIKVLCESDHLTEDGGRRKGEGYLGALFPNAA